jgi:DDRGK domain
MNSSFPVGVDQLLIVTSVMGLLIIVFYVWIAAERRDKLVDLDYNMALDIDDDIDDVDGADFRPGGADGQRQRRLDKEQRKAMKKLIAQEERNKRSTSNGPMRNQPRRDVLSPKLLSRTWAEPLALQIDTSVDEKVAEKLTDARRIYIEDLADELKLTVAVCLAAIRSAESKGLLSGCFTSEGTYIVIRPAGIQQMSEFVKENGCVTTREFAMKLSEILEANTSQNP